MKASKRVRISHEEAETTLIAMLKKIVTLQERHCPALPDSVSEYDERVSLYIAGHLCREGDGTITVSAKDIVGEDQPIEWAVQFIGRYGEEALYNLLVRSFFKAENDNLFDVAIAIRQDRRPELAQPSA